MLPMITNTDNGIQIFHLIDFRSFQAKIKFVGYPKINSTGDIFLLLFPKLNIVVNTSVLAKPHRPLIKNAHTVAINHHIIFHFS